MKVIVTAGSGFTDKAGEFHHYGKEFDMPEGPELEARKKDGSVREDDRMKPRATKPAAPEAAK